MSQSRMEELVREYAAAKSEQNVARALAVCDDDFVLETIPFGTRSRGKAETAEQLGMFFAAFPDYRVSLEGSVCGEQHLACWGEAEMTLAAPIFGMPATGSTARVPFCCVFTFRDALLAGERFFFDLASLCDQLGLSTDRMSAGLRSLRGDVVDAAAAFA